jgi:hypothetical protein
MIKKIVSIMLGTALSITGLVGASTITPEKTNAVTTGESGASYCDSDCQDSEIGATKVNYGGYTWDIIGLNNGGTKKGVSGPNNSVTLILDKSSYVSSMTTQFNSLSTNTHANSTLQSKTDSFLNSLTTTDGIIERTLTGGSTTGVSYTGYNAETVAGETVENQKLWPLSVNEAGQLKASVRAFPNNWWLRSPGNDGHRGDSRTLRRNLPERQQCRQQKCLTPSFVSQSLLSNLFIYHHRIS